MDILINLLAFGCGGFLGFILAAFLGVGRGSDDDFDGGYTVTHRSGKHHDRP